jgi:hypothetical protein
MAKEIVLTETELAALSAVDGTDAHSPDAA